MSTTTTVSAAEWRISLRLTKLAEDEHWPITDPLLKRIIREAGRAANMQRPVSVEQPGKSVAARSARKAALEREPEPVVTAEGECHQAGCSQSPIGWRLYVHEGWQPVCTRHMGGAKAVGRRFNRDLVADASPADTPPEALSAPLAPR